MAAYKSGHKFPALITPRGVASLAFLSKEDPRYGGYKVTVLLDKKDIPEGRIEWGHESLEGKAWVRHVQALAKEVGAPCKVHEEGFFIKDGDKRTDKEGKPIESLQGKLLLQFKSKHKPDVLDSRGNPLPRGMEVRGGDEIRVLFRPAFIEVNGKKYLTMYLNTVRLMAKHSNDGAEWGDEDGYVVPEGETVVDDLHEEGDVGESDDDSGDF